jgi:hypothetical protein
MGTFAEAASVYYRLLFADQRNNTSSFHLQQTNGSLPFPFSVHRKQIEVAIFR